ncbi:hypothetical protein RJ641_019585 [Dillenia turbinata]|uniref:RING-type domain-containing protein n=1 Tax=Dillenia turbinata TaxID=194707 RepID=A0AAN8YVJ7_9MAGN
MAIQAQLYSENLGFPLFGSQDFIDNCWYGSNEFCFGLQQKQQQQQQQQNQLVQQQLLQQRIQNHNQNHFHGSDKSFQIPSLKSNANSSQPMVFSQAVTSEIERQRHELDQFIRLQNERLRLSLQEQRKKQIATMLSKVESKAVNLLRQKDEEIAKAMKKAMELEELLRKIEIENQEWQRMAKENEATIVTLNNTLEQLRENNAFGCNSGGAEDVESYCEVNRDVEFDESREREISDGRKVDCRVCKSRNSCALFLPCRHLASCKACEAFLVSCPVCQTVKEGSIEVLI